MVKKWILDIREKTANMNRKEKIAYVAQYYWYHILITAAVIALIFIFGSHMIFRRDPVFTCVAVNQKTDTDWEKAVSEGFAGTLAVKPERVSVDSSCRFSYDDVKSEAANESSYEKFFLQWRYNELDAVIIPESFYKHCKKMSGRFLEVDKMGIKGLEVYEDNGKKTAFVLGEDGNGEKVLLAFPSSGKHEDTCRKFARFVNEMGQQGGISFEEIISK